MLLTLGLALGNLVLTWFGTYIVRLPGFDITPVAIVLIAQGGEGVLLGSLLLTLSYCIPRPSRFGWIWLQLPSAILIGYLSFIFPYPIALILLWHLISISAGFVLHMFDGRYAVYTFVSLGINIAIARVAAIL